MIIGFLKLFDLAVLVLALFVATNQIVTKEHGDLLAEPFTSPTVLTTLAMAVITLLCCHIILTICGLYRSRRLSQRRVEVVDVFKAMTLISGFLVAFGSFFALQLITVPFLATFWAMGTLGLTVERLTLRAIAARVRTSGRDLRYMLIIGTNPRAVEFARRITSNPERGYRLLGFVDDDWPGLNQLTTSGFHVVSSYSGLAEFLRRNVIDEVAIFLPLGSFYRHSSQVATLCQQHGITMRFSSDIFGLKTKQWRAEEFDGDHYIATSTDIRTFWPRTVKRAIDIALATLSLLALAPLLALTAICIKLTSPGPILFRQERIGVNKRRFKILKFRTMVPEAERIMAHLEDRNEVPGPVFKIKNDPRITPIGKFLRRSSIDELPQLVNVLIGDMSLVGPRPLPVRDYEGFNEDWQRRRFSVKPGITCLWQINGRSTISFDQWMLLDLQYMDQWSLWLDLKILAKTVPAVFRGAGAA